MENQKPQEPQFNEELIEETSIDTEPIGEEPVEIESTADETEVVTTDEATFDELSIESDLAQDSNAESEIESEETENVANEENGEGVESEFAEDLIETENETEEFAEEVVASEVEKEESVAESTDEQLTSDSVPVVQNGGNAISAFLANVKGKIGGAFKKWASSGLVIQSWQLAIAAVVVVAMVSGGVVLGVVLGNKDHSKGSDFNDSPVDYEWILPEGSSTKEGQIILPGYTELTFPAGEKRVDIVLPNPKVNPCHFRYTLILEETGEVLCQTKWIPPGQAVLQIELSRPLSKGEYSLVIVVDSVSLADGRTPMNGGAGKALLKVG